MAGAELGRGDAHHGQGGQDGDPGLSMQRRRNDLLNKLFMIVSKSDTVGS